jgi:selenide,water dikinase
MTAPTLPNVPRLTSLSHGGGCGCKIAPGVLAELLAKSNLPKQYFPALSDIYAMGGTPLMALAIVGMPINVLPHETIAKILEGGESVCRDAGIPLAGGHSIDSVEPIYGLVGIGIVNPQHMKRNADAKEGDVLILGKPLGVGVLSAALKKEQLDAAGYQAMVAATTRLNRPGTALSQLEGVHALTDVTGFGLLGHSLELARGAQLVAYIDSARLPLFPGVRELATQGMVTGASGRNWASYGAHITLAPTVDTVTRALLTDPQTSGGLLVSCQPETAPQVLALFAAQGFTDAAIIGSMHADATKPGTVVVS